MKKILYDGECPICRGIKDYAEKQVSENNFSFVPYQDDATSLNSPQSRQIEFEKSLLLLNEHGVVHNGARAVFEIMADFPGLLGILGKLFKLPPLFWLAEPFYTLFARYRYKVSEWIGSK